jgi:hypothetical protein
MDDYYDDDDRTNSVDSYAEDYTDDQVFIDFFDEAAQATTKGIQEYGEFGSSDAMEDGQKALDDILNLFEEHSEVIDFHELLDTANRTGGEEPVEDIRDEVDYKIDKILLVRKLTEYNPRINQYINDENDILLNSMFTLSKLEKYEKEISELENSEEATNLFLNIRIDITKELFYKKMEIDNYPVEQKEVKEYVDNIFKKTTNDDYDTYITRDPSIRTSYRICQKNMDYINPLLSVMQRYEEYKNLIQNNKDFNLENHEDINDLEYELNKNIFIESNMDNMNTNLKFKSSKVNHLQKHLTKILKKETLDFFNDAFENNKYNYNNLIHSYDKLDISNKIIDTFKKYKKYEALFKNHKALPESNPLHFDILKNDNIEEIDDFFSLAIDRNKTKLYAKRFLGSYLKLMDEESYKLFSIIKEKDINKNLIREELQKIALYKDSKTLNNVLTNLIDLNNLSITKIICNINDNKLDVDFVENTNDLLILTPNNYNTSNALGSSKWCISTSDYYFNNYLNKGNNDKYHFFIYDFKKSETDRLHKIAITVNDKNEITDAFDKNNTNIQYTINQIISPESFDKIKDKITYLQENKDNYATLIKLKDKKDITLKDIEENSDNPIGFYTYLIEDNKLKSFVNEFINSKEDIATVIKAELEKEPEDLSQIMQLKNVIEKENKSMVIDLEKITIDHSENILDFLSQKTENQPKEKKPKSKIKY